MPIRLVAIFHSWSHNSHTNAIKLFATVQTEVNVLHHALRDTVRRLGKAFLLAERYKPTTVARTR